MSFVSVIKSLEPLFSAALGVQLLKDYLPLRVWMSMLPVCCGIAVLPLDIVLVLFVHVLFVLVLSVCSGLAVSRGLSPFLFFSFFNLSRAHVKITTLDTYVISPQHTHKDFSYTHTDFSYTHNHL